MHINSLSRVRNERSRNEFGLSFGSSYGSKIVRNQARFEKGGNAHACRYDTYFTQVDTQGQSRWSAYSSLGGATNNMRNNVVVESLLVAIVLALAVGEACRRSRSAHSSAERSSAHMLQGSNVRSF